MRYFIDFERDDYSLRSKNNSEQSSVYIGHCYKRHSEFFYLNQIKKNVVFNFQAIISLSYTYIMYA